MTVQHKPVRKAVLPVAGLGTRLLPATKVMPKEMLTVVDRPLIQKAVEEAREAGIEEFVFVISTGKDMLMRHFQEPPEMMAMLEARNKTDAIKKVKESSLDSGRIISVYQEKALGLGHAVWCAHKVIGNEPFAVILPDDTVRHSEGCLSQMMKAYNQYGGNIVATCQVDQKDVSKYGILKTVSKDGRSIRIDGLVEKPEPQDAPSDMAIFGRYILQPEIFEHLEKHETGAGGEIQLTDALVHLLKDQDFHAYEFEGERIDCGNDIGFIKAQIAYGLDNPKLAPDILAYMKAKLEQSQ